MGFVFINYRRSETAGEARALCQDLDKQLGADRVFMDVDDIALGRDFREVLAERLANCDVMLSLIGPHWLECRDDAGRRRLDNTGDFVRIEIATALKRSIPVTPVLLQGARMPEADELPEDVRDLAFRNACEISHTRWNSDVNDLVRRLGLGAARPAPAAARSGTARVAIAGVSVAVIAAAAWLLWPKSPEPAAALTLTSAAAQRPTLESASMAGLASSRAPAPAVTVAPEPAAAAETARAQAPPSRSDVASAAELEVLVAALQSADSATRAEALAALQRKHAGSQAAVELVLAQLAPGTFNRLRFGRLELVKFLNESQDAAWTPEKRRVGIDAVHRVQGAIEDGRYKANDGMRGELERLARRLGA